MRIGFGVVGQPPFALCLCVLVFVYVFVFIEDEYLSATINVVT